VVCLPVVCDAESHRRLRRPGRRRLAPADCPLRATCNPLHERHGPEQRQRQYRLRDCVTQCGRFPRSASAGIPLAAAIATRVLIITILRKEAWFKTVFLPFIGPLALIGLLFTTLIIFAAQGKQVVTSIVIVCRIAAPLIVYFLITFFAAMLVCRRFGFTYAVTTAQSFSAASNNFELAIAVAIASFGADSPQALAATVGPLVECVFQLLRDVRPP
jgi:hypothetical protein